MTWRALFGVGVFVLSSSLGCSGGRGLGAETSTQCEVESGASEASEVQGESKREESSGDGEATGDGGGETIIGCGGAGAPVVNAGPCG